MADVPANYIKNKAIDFDGEIFASMGLPSKFAGLLLSPPSIGVFSLLETIDSVFVKDIEKASAMDFYRAFAISYYKKDCACEVREWLLGKGKERFNEDRPETWQAWDYKVAKFAKKHECDFWEMMQFHKFLLSVTFGGYEMIPSMGLSSSEYLFGADAIAGIIRLAGPALNYNFDKLIWEMPLAVVGHIAALEAKANGTKGVARPKDPDDIKLQFKLANEREKRGELHPWQIDEPNRYRPNEKQIKANPEINKEFNACMKNYLRKQREEKAEREKQAKKNEAA